MDIRIHSALLPGTLAASGDGHLPSAQQHLHFSRVESRNVHARALRATMARAVLAVVFAVLSACALFYSTVQAIEAYSLAQHYQAVQGRVAQTQCASHLQVGYAFDAGGATYRGSGMAHKRCDAYRIGEPVAVYFAPDNPAHSLNELRPEQEWHTPLALVLIELAVLTVLGLTLGLRKRD